MIRPLKTTHGGEASVWLGNQAVRSLRVVPSNVELIGTEQGGGLYEHRRSRPWRSEALPSAASRACMPAWGTSGATEGFGDLKTLAIGRRTERRNPDLGRRGREPVTSKIRTTTTVCWGGLLLQTVASARFLNEATSYILIPAHFKMRQMRRSRNMTLGKAGCLAIIFANAPSALCATGQRAILPSALLETHPCPARPVTREDRQIGTSP